MLIHAKGNLLAMAAAGQFDVIAHGCNCFNDMGGGIAKQIAELYPMALQADMDYDATPAMKLANFSHTRVGPELGHQFVIANAYTQFEPGAGSFYNSALEISLRKIMLAFPGERIGVPYIGCGIAGGNQEEIVDIFKNFAIEVECRGGTLTLVEYG